MGLSPAGARAPGSRAASFQISVTCRCSVFGCRCSDPWRTAAMKPTMTSSLTSPGLIPWALAYRASRDRPICARRPDRRSSNSTHSGLKLFLPVTGFTPLAFTAAMKSDRMLAKRFADMPTASGLIALSRTAIARISSGMPAGSLPRRSATRFTAERRSRRRVAESLPGRSRAASMVANVICSTPKSLQETSSALHCVVMPSLLSGMAPTRSREDRG